MREGGRRPGRRIGVEALESRRLLASGNSGSFVAAAIAQVTPMPAQVTSMPAGNATTPASSAGTSAAITPAAVATGAATSVTASQTSRSFLVGGSTFTVQVSGSGQVLARGGRAGAIVTLIGTDASTAVTIAQTRATHASRGAPFILARLAVRSRAIGSIDARSAVLNGPTIGLKGSIDTILLGSIGRRGTLQVDSLGTLNVGDVEGRLFANGGIRSATVGDVSGDVEIDGSAETLTAGDVPGRLTVGGSVTTLTAGAIRGQLRVGSLGTATVGNVAGGISVAGPVSSLTTGVIQGDLTVGGDVAALAAGGVAGRVQIGGDLGTLTVGAADLGPTGSFQVAGNLSGPATFGRLNLAGGRFAVGRDVASTLTITGDLTTSAGGTFRVGRDVQEMVIVGDMAMSGESGVTVARNLGTLNIRGNLDTSGGGRLAVLGNLNTLDVTGIIRGRLDRDVVVGLNLDTFFVRGGAPNAGGVDRSDIDVGKNIQNLDISQGVFNSRITAGVLIDGGSPFDGYNIGPDGPVAVYNSTITAGVQIRNLLIAGDVKSDRPTNPSGMPTRIVAGVDRAGNYTIGGNIDEFRITGLLIDAVIAASVKPNGGDGTTTRAAGNAPGDGGFNTYDAPAGTITGLPFPDSAPLTVFNFSAPPYDAAADPTVDDAVLPGSINRSFVAPPVDGVRAFPEQSTAGGVISTPHGDEADRAGFFALDTSGVFVGALPN